MTLAEFRAAHPEMGTVDDTMVQTFLNFSAAEIDETLFGARYDRVHGLLTCHNLCLSPYGQNARLQSAKGETVYGKQYQKIVTEVVCGLARVV